MRTKDGTSAGAVVKTDVDSPDAARSVGDEICRKGKRQGGSEVEEHSSEVAIRGAVRNLELADLREGKWSDLFLNQY